MKRIKFICDNCSKIIAVQLACPNEKIENHLFTIGTHEWCSECIYHCSYPEILTNFQKALITEDEMEIEKYGKVVEVSKEDVEKWVGSVGDAK